MEKDYLIKSIENLLTECNDIELLDLIIRLFRRKE